MKLLATLVLVCAGLFSHAHDDNTAFYNLSVENGQLILLVKLDLTDVQACLENEQLCNSDQEVKWCAATWVSNLINITLNKESLTEEFESSFTEEGHLIVRYFLGPLPNEINTLEVNNYCFLGSFPDYNNIVQVSMIGKQQGYKMCRNRTKLKIKLSNKL